MAVAANIGELVRSITGEPNRLWHFYRAVYKNVACGPTIGFRVDGEWVYNNDLTNHPAPRAVVDGVRVSSIVEGSDVEVEGEEFTGPDWQPSEFWAAVDKVNAEAEFYWDRDNSTWLEVYRPGETQPTAWLHWSAFEDEPEWDGEGDLTEEEKARVIDAVEVVFRSQVLGDEAPWFPARTRCGLRVETYENEGVY